MGNEDHSHTVSDSHCIQCIGKTRTTVIPILILAVFSVFVGNEDHCHTDFNFHWIQWIRWETRTAVSLILVLIVFTVPGKPEPLSYWFMFWLYSVYPRKSEDHSHTDSNCPLYSVYPMGNRQTCHFLGRCTSGAKCAQRDCKCVRHVSEQFGPLCGKY